jgi:glyoxylase-like metal-dependent hydrolase (beta-lactamase superfamily II)
MELKHIAGDTHYIPAPTNIGLYVRDQSVTLIDSGNDRDAGRKILKHIESKGWTLERIVNTHSNADHIGGNALLQRRTGCRGMRALGVTGPGAAAGLRTVRDRTQRQSAHTGGLRGSVIPLGSFS